MNINIEVTNDVQIIKTKVTELKKEIQKRQSEINILSQCVKSYTSQCTHPGMITGWNERDGNWGGPCEFCRYSY